MSGWPVPGWCAHLLRHARDLAFHRLRLFCLKFSLDSGGGQRFHAASRQQNDRKQRHA